MGAAARATEVDSAIEALDFETEPPSKVASAWLKKTGAQLGTVRRVLSSNPP